MTGVPPALWLFWAFAGLAVMGVALAAASRKLSLPGLLTAREWKAAIQIAAILAMILVMIYFQNAHRYDASEFIYGRF